VKFCLLTLVNVTVMVCHGNVAIGKLEQQVCKV